MRYIRQHIEAIIAAYDGSLPLAHYLKQYFKQFPKLGSRDRKMLGALAYTWYRAARGYDGTAWFELYTDEMISGSVKKLPQLTEWINSHNTEFHFDAAKLFPYPSNLSAGIEKEEWLGSMMVQPDLFIRIRKNKKEILSKLTDNNIAYTEISNNCLALPNGAKIDELLTADTYVVQDISSQQTGSFFKPAKNSRWLDCCAGAGGKSLLLKDMEPSVHLAVSDKRESIIHNLQQRFRLYAHKHPVAHIADAAEPEQLKKAWGTQKFEAIICDVPCSGSGTWARTPEQLYFASVASITQYSQLQQRIATNIAPYLADGGRLIYITCSVFSMENEYVTRKITETTGLTMQTSQMINGVAQRGDSMYVAILGRP